MPRGRGRRRPRRRSAARGSGLRCRARQSVPAGCVVPANRSSASRASSTSPARAAASTSSGSAHMACQGSMAFDVARRAAARRLVVAARGRCRGPRPPTRRRSPEPLPLRSACSIALAIGRGGLGFPPLECAEPQHRCRARSRSRSPQPRSPPPPSAAAAPAKSPVHARARAQHLEDAWQRAERTGVASELDLRCRDREHALEVPHERVGGQGHPAPAQRVLGRDLGERAALLSAMSESRRRVRR